MAACSAPSWKALFRLGPLGLLAAAGLAAFFWALPLAAPAQGASSTSGINPSFTLHYLAQLADVRYLAVGDLNGDGRLDIVEGAVCTSLCGLSQISQINLSTADGGWTNNPAINPFGPVAVGDLNNDGALDLVQGHCQPDPQPIQILKNPSLPCYSTGSTAPALVSWNDGHGHFTAGPTLGTADMRGVALGDLNGDGWLDIVVAVYLGQSVVYLNNGAGQFPTTVNFGLAADTPNVVALSDLNGDGALDIATGTDSGSKVYLNNGAATPGFSAASAVGAGTARTLGVALGDVNGDGWLDIVLGSYGQQSAVYLNNGAGGFASGAVNCAALTQEWCLGTAADHTLSVALADLNGDGRLDVVQGQNSTDGGSQVHFNTGGGAWTSAPFGSATDAWAVTAGDLNTDGLVDLLQANDPALTALFLNNGFGGLAAQPLGVVTNTVAVAVADLNGDGRPDILQGRQGDPLLGLYLGDGGGQFITQTLPGNFSHKALATGDLNGDGRLDFVTGGDNGVAVASQVYYSDGAGGFITQTIGAANTTSALALGDFNGDGRLDVLQGNWSGGLTNQYIYYNSGGGQWQAAAFASAINIHAAVAGDLNGDGWPDIVLGSNSQPDEIFYNDGAGGFITQTIGTASNTLALALGDFNGDGRLDIAEGINGKQTVIYYNGGGRTWQAQAIGTADGTSALAVVDLNGDGRLDLLQGNGQASRIFYNDGAGGWNRVDLGAVTSTNALAVGDLNGDGRPDIVQGVSAQAVQVYLNQPQTPAVLPNTPPQVSLAKPDPLANANFAYADPAARVAQIPLTYTLSDLEGDPVAAVRAAYSPDGGGQWFPAIAASGTVTQNLASVAGGLSLDGVNDYVSVTNVAGLAAGNSPHTLLAWLKPNGLPAYRSWPLMLGYFNSGSHHWLLNANGMMQIGVYGFSTMQITPTLPINTWTHLAAVFNGATLSVYLNGQLYGQTAAAFNLQGLPLSVGQPGGLENYYKGGIDGVRVYNRALSQAEVQANMRQLTGQAATGLVVDWPFDAGAGATAADQSLHGNPGTLVNGPVWSKGAPIPVPYVYTWDVAASGFFGRGDAVVFRLEAAPGRTTLANGTPLFQRPYASASTFPFRVRGTQVQVISGTTGVANALVYRLPAGQSTDGPLFGSGVLTNFVPFHTDGNGYLSGRGQINPGDRLLALAPVMTSTQGYALYYTNGTPQAVSMDAYTVTAAGGLQQVTVSAQHPLYLFDLNVSLEWDAHNDPNYLALLTTNLQHTSQYLYDFTDGQAALGDVYVFQNTAGWDASHITVRANDRLRPYAIIGGIVLTDTADPLVAGLGYGPGQVTLGATWNRYGRPGQMLGDDWAVILAHELGHYLFYQEDVYLGLDSQGQLKSVSTCTGSAMGDLYDRPQNTEFIFDSVFWNNPAGCADTLGAKSYGRTEWQTLRAWYPGLVAPSVTNPGPSLLPFQFTTVTVFDPLTPTATLADPTFYLNYPNNAVASSGARAYLIQNDAVGDWLLDLGGPIGGQNRLVARGAKPGDQLCIFDPAQNSFACQAVALGQDQVTMQPAPAWQPVVMVSPVSSVTLDVSVQNVPAGLTVQARIYPDLAYAPLTITLSANGSALVGTFTLTQTGLAGGDLRVWAGDVNAPAWESIQAYSVGGNAGGGIGQSRAGGGIGQSRAGGGIGQSRAGGGIGQSRAGGGIGQSRAGGGIGQSRAGGGIGQMRSGRAPLLSPDGQLIFFTAGNTAFPAGALFAIQSLAGLPPLPAGRTLIGAGYALTASPGAALPAGSLSVQYLSNDLIQAGARPEELALYFYDGAAWRGLPTTVDAASYEAVAPSQGPGLYALLAGIQLHLPGAGWNLLAYPLPVSLPVTQALASLDASTYSLVYGYIFTDTADPWKLYAPAGAPAYVNDLTTLDPGRGYWLRATQAVTWFVAPQVEGQLAPAPMPPSTFYGEVQAFMGFTPSAGLSVTAKVNGHVCGQGVTQTDSASGQIVYVVDVSAADTASLAGCGQAGAAVTFTVDGHPTLAAGRWTNDALTYLPLTPGQRVYFPMIRR